MKCKLIAAGVLYLITMGIYFGVFVLKEEDEHLKGLAFLNPVFLLASDIVIISLREQTVKIRV